MAGITSLKTLRRIAERERSTEPREIEILEMVSKG
jgi:hypothetical protein